MGEGRYVETEGVIFVAGFIAVFVALGGFAGQLGSSLESFQLWVQRVGGVMVVWFGLVLVGVGRRWVPERRVLARIPASGHVARPLVMGVAFGAAWTPCVGPLLGAALIVAARAADPLDGASLLGAYALGVGAPFVAAALAGSRGRRDSCGCAGCPLASSRPRELCSSFWASCF